MRQMQKDIAQMFQKFENIGISGLAIALSEKTVCLQILLIRAEL